MKKIIFLIIYVSVLSAQNPKLTLPPNYFDLSNILPLPTSLGLNDYHGSSTPTVYCHNSMIDASNNIKFFVADAKVYNSTGANYTPIGILTNPLGDVIGSQEICIVPDPANCTKYYIFSASIDPVLGEGHWFPTDSHVDLA